jgi:hypothetical protein
MLELGLSRTLLLPASLESLSLKRCPIPTALHDTEQEIFGAVVFRRDGKTFFVKMSYLFRRSL